MSQITRQWLLEPFRVACTSTAVPPRAVRDQPDRLHLVCAAGAYVVFRADRFAHEGRGVADEQLSGPHPHLRAVQVTGGEGRRAGGTRGIQGAGGNQGCRGTWEFGRTRGPWKSGKRLGNGTLSKPRRTRRLLLPEEPRKPQDTDQPWHLENEKNGEN